MILSDRQAEIEETLNRVPLVRWDRLVDSPDQLDVYGWIDRPDGRSDFVVVTFVSWAVLPGFVTSSADHESEIALALYGEDGDPTFPCERVESVLPGVTSAIRLP